MFAPLVLIAALPELGINLLSAATTQTSIRFHYTAGLIPVLIAAAVLGAARIVRRRPGAALPLATAAVVLGLTSNYILGPIPLWRYFPGGQQHQAYAAQVTEHDRIAARALKLIPASAVVSATNSLGAHLSARRRRAQLPVPAGRALGRRRRDRAGLRGPARAFTDRRPALLVAAQPRVAARLRA